MKLIILFFIFIINIIIIGYSKNLFKDDVKYFLDYNNYNFTNYTDNYTNNNTNNKTENYTNYTGCFDLLSMKLINRYNLNKMADSYDTLVKYEIGFWWCFFSFNLIQAGRLIHKIYIRIKNKKRRQIVKEEIGKNNFKNIMKEFREKKKKKKKLQNLDNSDIL